MTVAMTVAVTVTYTIQMTDLFTFTLTGNGPWAGTYYKV